MGSIKRTCLKITIRAAMFLVYLFIGAGLFILLESSYQSQLDEQARTTLENSKNKMRIKNVTEEELLELEKAIEEALDIGVIGSRTFLKNWDFANSFFFCGNVITTIGYGHITPRTVAGQIFVMIYALLGIPLTGFFLRTVGNELTTLIAFVIKLYERRMLNRESEKLEIKCAAVSMVLALVMLVLGSAIFSATERSWEYDTAFYFCFVTLTTIGFGDFVPGAARDNFGHGEKLIIEVASLVYYVLGLSIMSGVIVSISGVIEEKTKKLDIGDPMDAIRTLRLENLNSKAMKKLGYKVDEGVMPPTVRGGGGGMPPKLSRQNTNHILNMSSVNQKRRGTLIPDDTHMIRPPFNKTPTEEPSTKNGSLVNGTAREQKIDIQSNNTSGRTTPMSLASCARSSCATLHEDDETDGNKNYGNHNNNNKKSSSCTLQEKQTSRSGSNAGLDATDYFLPSDTVLDSSEYAHNNNQLKQENRCAIVISPAQNSQEELIKQNHSDEDDDENEEDTEYSYKEINFGEIDSKKMKEQKPVPKKFILREKPMNGINNANNVRANSLSEIKSDIHRKISRDRTKPITKMLKHTSSLKDLKIHYSSNLQTRRKDRKKECNSHAADSKRVGLPAELFANDVSFTVKKSLQLDCLATGNSSTTSFYSIPMTSPVASYTNPYFQHDDGSLPTVSSSLELPSRSDQDIEIKRPCTADRMKKLR